MEFFPAVFGLLDFFILCCLLLFFLSFSFLILCVIFYAKELRVVLSCDVLFVICNKEGLILTSFSMSCLSLFELYILHLRV